jgi:hypothetical protein
MKIAYTFVALLIVSLGVTQIKASVMSSSISMNGIEDQIQDNSVAVRVLDADTSGTVTVGDIVVGIIRLVTNTTDNIQISNTIGELDVLFSAEFTSGPTAPVALLGGLHFTVGPVDPAGATGFSIEEMLSSFPAASFPSSASTVFAVLGDPSPAADVTQGTLAAALAAFNSGSHALDMTGGFSSLTDFFEIELRDLNGDGVISALEYAAQSSGNQVGVEAGGFTVLSSPGLPAGSLFLPVSVTDLAGTTTTSHDVGLPSTALLRPNATELGNGWEFADQAIVKINVQAIPEPASLLVWSVIVVTASGFGIRRRRRHWA